MCHLYIVYYRFMNDYPMFVYSGLPWTTIRNECTKWRRWLDSDEAKNTVHRLLFIKPILEGNFAAIS